MPKTRTPAVTAVAVVALAGAMQFSGEAAQQAQTPSGCRVTGRVTSVVNAPAPFFGGRGRAAGAAPGAAGQAGAGATPAAPAPPTTIALPVSGATLLVYQGTRLVVATAADADGRFSILFTPGQTFQVTASMAAFQDLQKELTLGALPCDAKLDFDLSLAPRDKPVASAAGQSTQSAATGAGTAPAGASSAPTGRFTQLTVRSDPAGAATLDVTPPDQSAELARLLPPGFTLQGASADAISVTARGDAINVDRGILNDRMSGHRARRVRSGHRPVRGGLQSAHSRRRIRPGWRSRRTERRRRRPRRAGRTGRIRARWPRRTRPEPVSGIRELFVRRIGARLDELPAAQRHS
jgi:hypothetical protein